MIAKVMMNIGAFFLISGGVLLLAMVLAFCLYIVGTIWIFVSNKWWRICREESLIFEYLKNRDLYLRWKNERRNGRG